MVSDIPFLVLDICLSDGCGVKTLRPGSDLEQLGIWLVDGEWLTGLIHRIERVIKT